MLQDKAPVLVPDAVAKHQIFFMPTGKEGPVDIPAVRAFTRQALHEAVVTGLCSIALPPLGSGPGGLDGDAVAAAMVSEARRNLACGVGLGEVIFVLDNREDFKKFTAQAGREKIICLGDSITFGFPYGPPVSWVSLCSERLGLHMVNRGINGDTTRQMRARFRYDVVADKPAYVIILGGTNDVWMGAEPRGIRNNLRAMVEEAFEEGICPVLGIPVPTNTSSLRGFPSDPLVIKVAEELKSLGEWVRSFAAEQLLPLLDFYAPLLDGTWQKANPACFMDEAHPNQAGYRLMAAAVEPALLNLKKGLQ